MCAPQHPSCRSGGQSVSHRGDLAQGLSHDGRVRRRAPRRQSLRNLLRHTALLTLAVAWAGLALTVAACGPTAQVSTSSTPTSTDPTCAATAPPTTQTGASTAALGRAFTIMAAAPSYAFTMITWEITEQEPRILVQTDGVRVSPWTALRVRAGVDGPEADIVYTDGGAAGREAGQVWMPIAALFESSTWLQGLPLESELIPKDLIAKVTAAAEPIDPPHVTARPAPPRRLGHHVEPPLVTEARVDAEVSTTVWLNRAGWILRLDRRRTSDPAAGCDTPRCGVLATGHRWSSGDRVRDVRDVTHTRSTHNRTSVDAIACYDLGLVPYEPLQQLQASGAAGGRHPPWSAHAAGARAGHHSGRPHCGHPAARATSPGTTHRPSPRKTKPMQAPCSPHAMGRPDHHPYRWCSPNAGASPLYTPRANS